MDVRAMEKNPSDAPGIRLGPAPGTRTILYLSSSIGLGHVSKDLAIAGELRRACPDLEIVWLAGDPARHVLAEAGETLLPQASRWSGASAIAERSMRGGQLNLVRYVYRSLPSFARNMRLVLSALGASKADALVGDEAWEIFVPLCMRILRLRVPFVMITDFVGVDAVGRNPIDRAGAYLLNALWSLDRDVIDGRPHSMIFIGEPEDIPDVPFGPGASSRRAHAEALYDFVGHAVRFRAEEMADREGLRRRLGYGREPLVICAVGGTSVGADLLDRCGAAFASVRERIPGARMVLVRGPRLAEGAVQAPPGVEVRGYVEALYEHFACADVAVVQCGASSTTELAALRTPFVYVPVPGHFEQEQVAKRLERYGVGTRVALGDATPDRLAAAIAYEWERSCVAAAMPVEGAANAARHILGVLDGGSSSSAPPSAGDT